MSLHQFKRFLALICMNLKKFNKSKKLSANNNDNVFLMKSISTNQRFPNEGRENIFRSESNYLNRKSLERENEFQMIYLFCIN